MIETAQEGNSRKKLSLILQAIILLLFVPLTLEIQFQFQMDTNFILTRFILFNFLLTLLLALRNTTRSPSISRFTDIALHRPMGFLAVWGVNIILNWAIVFTNLSGRVFFRTESIQDWIVVISHFISTCMHYQTHNTASLLSEQLGGMWENMKSIQFMTYTMNFAAYALLMLICTINNTIQRAFIYIIFCKFFDVILNFRLISHCARITLGALIILEILNKLSNSNQLTFQIEPFFLVILALVTSLCVLNSMFKIYSELRLSLRRIGRRRILRYRPQMLLEEIPEEQLHGLSVSELIQLKKVNTSTLGTIKHNESCSICYQDIEDISVVYLLGCQHVFHADCLEIWLKYKNNCPNCRCTALLKGQGNQMVQEQQIVIEIA